MPTNSEWTKERVEELFAGISPTPWRYAQRDGFIVGPGHRSTVAQTWSKSEEDFSNAKANGKFIAASPEIIRWLLGENTELTARVAELERRLRIPSGTLGCAGCGGPHDFDTSVPSVVWNRIIRAKGLPQYLCTTCIVREFVKAGEGFTAQLWSEEFNGVSIEIIVNGQNAKDASAVQEENNTYRVKIADLLDSLTSAREEAFDEAIAIVQHGRDGCKEESPSWVALDIALQDIRKAKQ